VALNQTNKQTNNREVSTFGYSIKKGQIIITDYFTTLSALAGGENVEKHFLGSSKISYIGD